MGVVLAETRKAAESVIAAFRQLDANILVQGYIKEAGGTDIRAFVVGTRVVASMQRQSAPGEFRSNLHRGGTAEKIRQTPGERSMAVRAARTMGLNVCGVQPVVMPGSGPAPTADPVGSARTLRPCSWARTSWHGWCWRSARRWRSEA